MMPEQKAHKHASYQHINNKIN